MLPPAGSPHPPSYDELLAFAREELGHVSEALLRQPEVAAEVEERLAAGAAPEDAVLGVLHRRVGTDRGVANEFAAFFLYELRNLRKVMSSSSRLRRFLDTGDLVQSVFGDLWSDIAELDFNTLAQFKTLFALRVQRKLIDQERHYVTARRREDKRLQQQPEELSLPAGDEAGTPLSYTIRQEERERLILILLRLKKRDGRLLAAHLKGTSLESIAEAEGLSYEAARRALARAIEQARSLADASDRRRGSPD